MSKIIAFLEQHVEKIILGIVGLVCMWLLLSKVIFSPNVIEYEGKRFSPGAIDTYISQQAKDLETKLGQPPEKSGAPESPLRRYVSSLNCSVSKLDVSQWPVVPEKRAGQAVQASDYKLPQIGPVRDAALEYIRAVAYVPTTPVTPDTPYERTTGQAPEDIDLVTMEAKFDLAALYNQFFESFAGDDVSADLRDPCSAKPLFAAVNLQRRELLEDGGWGQWRDVPRTRIDHRRDLFTIIEKVSDLPPGGLAVRMLQYNAPDAQIDLLQPTAYQIASANDEWFPPLIHRKFLEVQRFEDLEAKRKEREDQLAKDSQNRDNTTRGGSYVSGGTTGTRTRRTTGGSNVNAYDNTGGLGDSLYGVTGGTGRSDTRTRRSRTDPQGMQGESGAYADSGTRRTRRTTSTDRDIEKERELLLAQREKELASKPSMRKVYDELDQVTLTRNADFSKLKELVFWAHDDTVEPMKTYQYRIRLGVFNPVAGPRSESVILWSGFSDISNLVRIPGRMYFFALGTQEADQAVQVQISKYLLGRWYSEPFKVMRGEAIGGLRQVEDTSKSKTKALGTGAGGPPGAPRPGPLLADSRFGGMQPSQVVTEPQEIDYNTGALLVDISSVSDWEAGSKMTARRYNDMLYSFDGMEMKHMAIGSGYWLDNLKTAHADISRAQKEPKEPLKPWDSTGRKRRPVQLEMGGVEIDETMYEEMLMMQGGGNF